MLRRLYDWTMDQAERPHAIWVMAGISFAESSFFPLPPDLILIPMCLARRERVFWYATVATLSSVLGGFLGYAIGFYLYDSVGQWVIEHMVSASAYESTKALFDKYGFWAIVFKGLTPIPYKLVTILSGFMRFDLASFAVASLIARGIRFYAEAILLYFFGEQARAFIEERLMLVMSVTAILLVGIVILIKLI